MLIILPQNCSSQKNKEPYRLKTELYELGASSGIEEALCFKYLKAKSIVVDTVVFPLFFFQNQEIFIFTEVSEYRQR